MKVSSLALLAVGVSAKTTVLPNADIKANSKTGNRILSKARRLGGQRQLEENVDATWVAGYSLKFHSCYASQDYYGGQFANNDAAADGDYNYDAQEGGNNNNYYNYDNQEAQQQEQEEAQEEEAQEEEAQEEEAQEEEAQEEEAQEDNAERKLADKDYTGMYQNKQVHFQLCPSSSCGGWGSSKGCADYVVDMGEYVKAVLEAKMTAIESACEIVKENCSCGDDRNNYNYQSRYECMSTCYDNAKAKNGWDVSYEACVKDEGQQEESFDLYEALECSQVDIDNETLENYRASSQYQKQMQQMKNGNGYYYQQQQQEAEDEEEIELYVGPTCSKDGKSIILATFSEETCSIPAPTGMYEALNYGVSIPYSSESLVDNKCISCKEPSDVQYQNYYDQQDADEITESCATLYQYAGKCEQNLPGYMYQDNRACTFIENMKSPGILSSVNTNVPAKVFAGIFAVTTVVLATVSALLYQKNSRQNVRLTADTLA